MPLPARDPETARAIVDELLAKSDEAVLAGDAEAFARIISLPYQVESFEGFARLETRAELDELFLRNVDYYRTIGLTDLDRRCLSAEFRTEDMIVAVFESRLIQFGNQLAREPFLVYVELRREGQSWRSCFAQYAIADSPAHNKVLVSLPSCTVSPPA